VRPVNLIPPEDRRGEQGPLRTGPLPYGIVGVLVVALFGVIGVVMTNNTIEDRKAEKASLETQVAQAQAEAERLRVFTDFASLQQARQETVKSLATSRFDWERVLRELAIVIPDDVWLTNVDAKASADAATSSTSSTASQAESIAGPSLDIQGCASGHEAVAKFLAALRGMGGVTRVTVVSSDRPDEGTTASTTSDSTGEGTGVACASRDFISTFQIVAAFDAATPAAPVPASPAAPDVTTTASASDEG
jgi:Tfp pilus assembly protein PilN